MDAYSPPGTAREGYRSLSRAEAWERQASMRNRLNTIFATVLADFVDLVIFFSLGAFLTMMVLALK